MNLKDPLKNRQVNNIPLPPQQRLQSKHVWNKKDEVQWKIIREFQEKQGLLSKSDVLKILNKCYKILCSLIRERAQCTQGDLHGQYYDLLTVFRLGGKILKGDYVDRGYFSCEIIILLFAMKIQFPDRILLLRGNHETREMTYTFNFSAEVNKKYDQEVFQSIMRVFDALPLAAVINGKFLAVHGGISPELNSLENLNKIQRFKEVPTSGLFCDLVWSDPVSNNSGSQKHAFQVNEGRNCSYYYGKEAVKKFLQNNKLLSIIRAHEVQFDGFKLHEWSKKKDQKLPMVITIFSAPNYCDRYLNKAAIIKLENDTIDIEQFHYKNSPFYLPNFLNLFEYSIPFISKNFMMFTAQLIKYTQRIKGGEISDVNLSKVVKDLNNDPEFQKKIKNFQQLQEDNKNLVQQRKQRLLEESKKQSIDVEKIAENQRREKFIENQKQEINWVNQIHQDEFKILLFNLQMKNNIETDPLDLMENFKPEIDYSQMEDKMDNTIQPLEAVQDNLQEKQINFVKANPEFFNLKNKVPEIKGLIAHTRGIPQTARWYRRMTSLQPNGLFVMWTRRSNIFLVTALFFSMVIYGNIQHVMTGRYYSEFDTSQESDFIIYEKLYARPVSEKRVWARPA